MNPKDQLSFRQCSEKTFSHLKVLSTLISEIHIFELRIKIELYVGHRSEGVSTYKAVEKKKPGKEFRLERESNP